MPHYAYIAVIDNFMRKLLSILLFVFLSNGSFGSCAGDDRTLTEMLFQGKAGTIFTCEILEYPIMVKRSDYQTDYTATAKIIKVFFGKVDSNIVTLRVGLPHVDAGNIYLVYTSGIDNIFSFGYQCDTRSKEVTYHSDVQNELIILQQFSDIFKQKSTGSFSFVNANNVVLAKGQYNNGEAIEIWQHFYDSGNIKAVYDLSKNSISQYKPNGFIKSRSTINGNIRFSEQFSDSLNGQYTFTSRAVTNDSISISTSVRYYDNGEPMEEYSTVYITRKHGGTISTGKTGDYKEYHENGNIKIEGYFKEGRRIGFWKWYNENGVFYTEFDYKDGSGAQ